MVRRLEVISVHGIERSTDRCLWKEVVVRLCINLISDILTISSRESSDRQ